MTFNTRSPEQWDIIKAVDFKDKVVLDLGCGYGDLSLKVAQAGAKAVYSIDKDSTNNQLVVYKAQALNNLHVVLDDLDGWDDLHPKWDTWLGTNNSNKPFKADIMLCFSVLPYLKVPSNLLRIMSQRSLISLIECQYNGDGPGFSGIKNDRDMAIWLSPYFDNIEPLGKSLVEGRGLYRTIWLCTQEGLDD